MVTEEQQRIFLEQLCTAYHEKILRYLYHSLGDESAARDCTQEVFLVACRKAEAISQHPNPGGFLFQTAKNLACKVRRENFLRLVKETSIDDQSHHPGDPGNEIERLLDRQIDEFLYIESVLSRLTDEKRKLYNLYYLNHLSMAQIARILGVKEPAVRMRYVRLRQEIRDIISEVAENNFY